MLYSPALTFQYFYSCALRRGRYCFDLACEYCVSLKLSSLHGMGIVVTRLRRLRAMNVITMRVASRIYVFVFLVHEKVLLTRFWMLSMIV